MRTIATLRRNPWLGLLWAVAIVLIIGSYSAGVWQATFYYPPPGQPNPGPVVVFFQQLIDAVRFPALTVGFATVGGLLFLHARNHARKARRHSPD